MRQEIELSAGARHAQPCGVSGRTRGVFLISLMMCAAARGFINGALEKDPSTLNAHLCAVGLSEEEKKKRAERAKRFGVESFDDKKQVRGHELCLACCVPTLTLSFKSGLLTNGDRLGEQRVDSCE